MTVDLYRLKHFSMTYVFMDAVETACEYEQTEQSPIIDADGNSIRFVLKNIDQNEDKEHYTVVLLTKGDGEFYIKSDYFDDADELYPLDAEPSDQDVMFVLEGEDEVMYLYGFFD